MRKTRILLVDDETTFTRLLKLNLEKLDRYEVRVENAGAQAQAAAVAFEPDLVFMDVMMPDVDGAEVASRMRADPRLAQIPIIFLTAVISKEEEGRQGKTAGGYTFVAKPVSIERIVECIDTHVGGGPRPAEGA
ncbi:MAG TPA: response regulator [bacterium]